MKRLLIMSALIVGVFANAARAEEKVTGGSGTIKEMNCGAHIQSLVPLPTKFAELMTAVSDGMTAHAAWVGASKDPAAKAEAAALKKLAQDHKTLAANAKKAATDMEADAKLAAAPHDTAKMDPKAMGESMMKQATLEKEMAALMMKDAEETEKQVKEMSKQTAMK